jgi:hypothetical protein
MSDSKMPVYIFHINRKEGGFLFLRPFLTPDKLVYNLENKRIIGHYGTEPRAESLTYLKKSFYLLIEEYVRTWLSDIRFIPKFLLAALAFIVVYFFMSVVVPDHIPVFDELLLALIAAFIVYYLIGKRDLKSQIAEKKRLKLRDVVDHITFYESNFVKRLEKNLHKNEEATLEDITENILNPEEEINLSEEEKEEARQFVRCCELLYQIKNSKKKEKVLKRIKQKEISKKMEIDLKKLKEQKNVDFPLYAVYKRFKNTVSNIR